MEDAQHRRGYSVGLAGLLIACALAPFASGYFWTSDPASWDHDDEPPEGSLDGTAGASYEGAGGLSLNVDLLGSTEENAPSPITKTEAEEGLSCVWVVEYGLHIERVNGYDSRAGVELDLDLNVSGSWQDADTDSAWVVIYTFSNGTEREESGWLYVYADCNYSDGMEFRLTCTAYVQIFQHGGWEDYGSSPESATVFFIIDKV